MVEKERERNMKGKKASTTEFNDALSHISDDRTICMTERRQAVSKTDKNRCEFKKRKIEMEIMKLDVAIDAMHQDYFSNLHK